VYFDKKLLRECLSNKKKPNGSAVIKLVGSVQEQTSHLALVLDQLKQTDIKALPPTTNINRNKCSKQYGFYF